MNALKLSLLSLCAAAMACNSDNSNKPKIDVFAAVPATIAAGDSATLLWGTSGNVAKLSLSPGGDVTGNSLVVKPTATTQYTLTATGGGTTVTASTTVTVSGTASTNVVRFAVTLPATVTAGTAAAAAVKAVDGSGNTVTGYTGTAHFTSDDANAVLPADVAFNAAAAGAASVNVTFKTAGGRSLLVSDGTIAGFASTAVSPGPATHLALSALPANASAGQALPFTASLTDAFGNAATTYTGTLHFTSTDGAASVPADTAFTAGDAGSHGFSVTFDTVGAQTVTAGDGTLTATSNSVNVTAPVASDAVAVVFDFSESVNAGQESSGSVTVVDANGAAATSYSGTLHFTTSDAHEGVILPADLTFTAGQATQSINATLFTSGVQTITAADTTLSGLTGSALTTVNPGAPNSCTAAIIGLAPQQEFAPRRRDAIPSPTPAGLELPVQVTLFDAYGNIADGSGDDVALQTNDEQAAVSGSVILPAGQPAVAAFSLQFHTAYLAGWSIQGEDQAQDFSCTSQSYPVVHGDLAGFQVNYSNLCTAAPVRGMRRADVQCVGDVIAGQPQSLDVTEVDAYGNVIDDSHDTIYVVTPNDPTVGILSQDFTGQNGQGTFEISFGTVGLQPALVMIGEGGFQTMAGPLQVHGFVYTPPSGQWALSLQPHGGSTASTMMLDLATFDGGEVRLYAAGVNLPVSDGIGAVSIAPAQLNVGSGTQALAAALANTGQGSVVLAGASQKRAGAGANTDDVNLSDGDAAFTLSLTLADSPSYPAVIFDGANLGPGYRAGARDHLGNEVLHSWDIGIGKLEIR